MAQGHRAVTTLFGAKAYQKKIETEGNQYYKLGSYALQNKVLQENHQIFYLHADIPTFGLWVYYRTFFIFFSNFV